MNLDQLQSGLLVLADSPYQGWRLSNDGVRHQLHLDQGARRGDFNLLVCPSPRLAPQLVMRWFPTGDGPDSYQKLDCRLGEPGNVVKMTISSHLAELKQTLEISYHIYWPRPRIRFYNNASSLVETNQVSDLGTDRDDWAANVTAVMLPSIILEKMFN